MATDPITRVDPWGLSWGAAWREGNQLCWIAWDGHTTEEGEETVVTGKVEERVCIDISVLSPFIPDDFFSGSISVDLGDILEEALQCGTYSLGLELAGALGFGAGVTGGVRFNRSSGQASLFFDFAGAMGEGASASLVVSIERPGMGGLEGGRGGSRGGRSSTARARGGVGFVGGFGAGGGSQGIQSASISGGAGAGWLVMVGGTVAESAKLQVAKPNPQCQSN